MQYVKKLWIIPYLWCFFPVLLGSCQKKYKHGSFGYALNFLKKHQEVFVLKNNNDQCQLAIVPDWQGRIMTSTSGGLSGKSYGWINYELIESGDIDPQFNPFGGEDRIWLGPEGGQYALFFKKGSDFSIDNWNTPASIDTEPFELTNQSHQSISFQKDIQITNYANFQFNLEINRKVTLLNQKEIETKLELDLKEEVSYVGFQSENSITNIGTTAFSKESGLVSIWILGMFNPSDKLTVIIPYKGSLDLNTKYFGEIDQERLKIHDEVVLFKGDGKYRSKIGLPPKNIKPVFGSFDSINNILTIVEFTFKGDTTYVNSLWEMQDKPYNGDVINSYNDGPLKNGKQLGPFYELESSSSAKELLPGESIFHCHRTYHFEGNITELSKISKKILGFRLDSAVLF